MKAAVFIAILLFGIGRCCWGDPPPDSVFKKLTAVIRAHYPDASIDNDNDGFEAKHGTTMVTIQRAEEMCGKIPAQTYEEEVPTDKGFQLIIAVETNTCGNRIYRPQEFPGTNHTTFSAFPATEDGKNRYVILFSYGSRIDPMFKHAIFDALPGHFRPDSGAIPQGIDKDNQAYKYGGMVDTNNPSYKFYEMVKHDQQIALVELKKCYPEFETNQFCYEGDTVLITGTPPVEEWALSYRILIPNTNGLPWEISLWVRFNANGEFLRIENLSGEKAMSRSCASTNRPTLFRLHRDK